MTEVTKSDLVQELLTGEVEITYNKKSAGNTTDTIRGTLKREVVEQFVSNTETTSKRTPNDEVLHFVSTDRNGWRSVRVDSVVGYKKVG